MIFTVAVTLIVLMLSGFVLLAFVSPQGDHESSQDDHHISCNTDFSRAVRRVTHLLGR